MENKMLICPIEMGKMNTREQGKKHQEGTGDDEDAVVRMQTFYLWRP